MFQIQSLYLGRHATTILSSREIAIILARTSRDGNNLRRTLNLLKVEIGIVGIVEPVKAPEAAVLEGLGHALALVAGADAAVLRAGDPAVLGRAAVEEADAATGHEDVELVIGDVAAGVGRLDDHCLAGGRAVSEGESALSVSVPSRFG